VKGLDMTTYYSQDYALQYLARYPEDEFIAQRTETLSAGILSIRKGNPIIRVDWDGFKFMHDPNDCTERNDWELVAKTYTTIEAMTALTKDK
jgi:hypothetical protein